MLPNNRHILDKYTLIQLLSVAAIYTARAVELKAKRDTIRGQIRENLTLKLFFLVGTLVTAGSVLELLLAERGLNWPLFLLGWTCAAFSFWLRRRAIAALGRFWSLHVEIREGHEFVRSGPFRFMRHPTYFSMILELLAFALVCNAIYPLLVIALFFVPVLLMRLRIEEGALVEKFGDAYREYQRTTPALLPYRWSGLK